MFETISYLVSRSNYFFLVVSLALELKRIGFWFEHLVELELPYHEPRCWGLSNHLR